MGFDTDEDMEAVDEQTRHMRTNGDNARSRLLRFTRVLVSTIQRLEIKFASGKLDPEAKDSRRIRNVLYYKGRHLIQENKPSKRTGRD